MQKSAIASSCSVLIKKKQQSLTLKMALKYKAKPIFRFLYIPLNNILQQYFSLLKYHAKYAYKLHEMLHKKLALRICSCEGTAGTGTHLKKYNFGSKSLWCYVPSHQCLRITKDYGFSGEP